MLKLLRSRVLEYFLTVVISITLCISLNQLFDSSKVQMSGIWTMVIITAAILFILNMLFYNVKTAFLALLIIMVLLVVFAVLSIRNHWLTPSNLTLKHLLFYLDVSGSAAVSFSTLRFKPGIVILFLGGLGVDLFISAQQKPLLLPCLIIFLLCIGILFMRMLFFDTTSKIDMSRKAQLSFIFVTVTVCTVSLLLSAGLYYAVIKPLHPPAKNLSPMLTRQKAYEQLVVKYKPPVVKKPVTKPINWPLDSSAAVTVILGVIVLAFLAKKTYRMLRRHRLYRLDKNSQVVILYNDFIKTLAKIGYEREEIDTPYEFAEDLRKAHHPISFGPHDLSAVTNVFVRVQYGSKQATDQEYQVVRGFDKDFLKYCRKSLGTRNYLLKYLTL